MPRRTVEWYSSALREEPRLLPVPVSLAPSCERCCALETLTTTHPADRTTGLSLVYQSPSRRGGVVLMKHWRLLWPSTKLQPERPTRNSEVASRSDRFTPRTTSRAVCTITSNLITTTEPSILHTSLGVAARFGLICLGTCTRMVAKTTPIRPRTSVEPKVLIQDRSKRRQTHCLD